MKEMGNQQNISSPIKIIMNRSIYVFLGLFFLFELLQMSQVFLYHDDYGYATLSYADLFLPQSDGYRHSLGEIFAFLYKHYTLWGGRVCAFFVELLLLQEGVWLWRIVQTFIAVGIMYLILTLVKVEDNIFATLMIFALWFAIPLEIVADGKYWLTASVLYFFPMLSFFVACKLLFLQEKLLSSTQRKILYICLFCSACSCEIIACGTIWIVFCAFVVLPFLNKRIVKFSKFSIRCIFITSMGFLFLMCAPGNFIRATNNSTGIAERICSHIVSFMIALYHQSGKTFQVMIIITILIMSIVLFKKKVMPNVIMIINTGMFIVFLVASFKYPADGFFNALMHWWKYNQAIVVSFLVLYTLMCLLTTFFYAVQYKEEIIPFLILLSGFAMEAFMLIAPSEFPARAALPLYIIYVYILGYVWVDVAKIKVCKICIIISLVFGMQNYFEIYQGYSVNALAHTANEYILENVSEEYYQGEYNTDIVSLYQIPKVKYASGLPQDENYKYVETWIKRYYNLPQEIDFKYDRKLFEE